jgi:hypothetical protein
MHKSGAEILGIPIRRMAWRNWALSGKRFGGNEKPITVETGTACVLEMSERDRQR